MGNLYRNLKSKVEGSLMQGKAFSKKKGGGGGGVKNNNIGQGMADTLVEITKKIEDFPTKKLEALRTSSTLYSKLESIIKELKNLKIEPPLPQLLDKVSRSFTKIKGDIDALERTKDEEAKIFKGYNIEFDFQNIMRIKETMVYVSSDCMALALKVTPNSNLERREGDGQNKNGGVKLLWRVFQFAFQVYTFAGGHDDRAEKLTQELAQEIEKEAENQ
ncbi:hypothetical protein J1N35_008040 [Gossypium stocksii]|uniref:Uncharacterized protein n=1 Tax=Gossypium stocksii TaxID=47602 RepID=A0A9D3W8N4_9ROSI|nr:hypothetical protein J1N35_008040 [Gossypium stocksii]